MNQEFTTVFCHPPALYRAAIPYEYSYLEELLVKKILIQKKEEREQMRWLNKIKYFTKKSVQVFLRIAQDRHKGGTMVHRNITRQFVSTTRRANLSCINIIFRCFFFGLHPVYGRVSVLGSSSSDVSTALPLPSG